MPYTSITDVPDHVKKYSKKKQRRWRSIWNSVFKQTGSETRAFKAANASLKQEAETMDMRAIVNARLTLLGDLLVQAGKRLSAATVENLKATVESLKALIGEDEDDEPDGDAVEQAWRPVEELMLQEVIVAESLAGSVESLLAKIDVAIRALAAQDDWAWRIATIGNTVIFSREAKGQDVTYHRAKWTINDDDDVELSDIEAVKVEQVVTAVQEAAIEGDAILEQARADVSPADKKRAAKEYGDVEYADPENKKYPIDTKKHTDAAWNYINMPKNAKFYNASQLVRIKGRIRKAAKKFGIELSDEKDQSAPLGFVIPQGEGKLPFLIQQSAFSPESVEQVEKKGTVKFAGVATVADVVNSYKQVYPLALWEQHVELAQAKVANGKMVGATWHPQDAQGAPRNPHVHEVSHIFTGLQMEDNKVQFEAETLLTQAGKDLGAALLGGVGVDMSTRAIGKTKAGDWNGQKVEIVQADGFEWFGTDVVLEGASPGSGIEYARLQSLSAEPKEAKAMEIEEIKKLTQEAIAAGDLPKVAEHLAALQETVKGLEQAAMSEADKTLLQEAKALVEESKAAKVAAERDKKVGEVVDKMVADKELPDQFRQSAVGIFKNICNTVEEVDAKIGDCKEALNPLLAQHALLQSKGAYVSEYKADGTKKEKIHNGEQAIEELIQTRIDRGILPKDTGLDDPSNMVRNVRVILQAMAVEHREYLRGYMMLRNGDLGSIADMKNVLQQDYDLLRQDVPTGAMTTDDVAAAIPYLMPIVTELIPQLIANRYASLQPMSRSLGTIAYWKIKDEDGNYIKTPSEFTGSYANDPGEKETIKKLKGALTTENISPTAKKLGYDLSVEVVRRLRTDWGMDASGVMVAECAAEIAREWNYNHLASMVAGATAGNWTYGTAIPADASFDGEQWQKQIINYLYMVRSGIRKLTFAPTVAILGESDATARILWLAKEVGNLGDAPMQGAIARGVNIDGALATGEEIVSVDWWEDLGMSNKLLIIGRGREWYRSGFIVAPYLGLYVTPVWVDPETLDVQQGMLSEVAEKMVDGNYFATLTIDEGVAGNVL